MSQKEVQRQLRDIEELMEAKFPKKYLFEKKPFHVEEREDAGLSILVKESFFGNARIGNVDLAYEPSDYQYNWISFREEYLRKIAVDYFNEHNLPFN